MHEAVLADVEIAAAGCALPVVRAATREVSLEVVLVLYRIERRRQRSNLVVDALLLRRQRDQAAVTVVDQPDRGRETQFDRPPVRSSARPRGYPGRDRKSTRLNSSHSQISYAVF